MSRTPKLINDLDSPDPRESNDAAVELADSDASEAIPHLLRILDQGDSRKIGAIAYALGELKVEESKAKLIALARDPKTRGNRGSLIYALMNLSCDEYMIDIVDFSVDDFVRSPAEGADDTGTNRAAAKRPKTGRLERTFAGPNDNAQRKPREARSDR